MATVWRVQQESKLLLQACNKQQLITLLNISIVGPLLLPWKVMALNHSDESRLIQLGLWVPACRKSFLLWQKSSELLSVLILEKNRG